MQMLILTVLTLILGGATALLAITFYQDGSRIMQALQGHGVSARYGKRKKHQYRVNFVNFGQRKTTVIAPELARKQRTNGIRLIVDNDGRRAGQSSPTAQQPLAA